MMPGLTLTVFVRTEGDLARSCVGGNYYWTANKSYSARCASSGRLDHSWLKANGVEYLMEPVL